MHILQGMAHGLAHPRRGRRSLEHDDHGPRTASCWAGLTTSVNTSPLVAWREGAKH